MGKFFEVDFFLEKNKPPLETNMFITDNLAGWLNVPIWYVKEWAIYNSVDSIIKSSKHYCRKYYLWNETKVREFVAYHNNSPYNPEYPHETGPGTGTIKSARKSSASVSLPEDKMNIFIENNLKDNEGTMEHKRMSIQKLFASYLKERGFSLEVDEEVIDKALTDSVKFADYVKENYVPHTPPVREKYFDNVDSFLKQFKSRLEDNTFKTLDIALWLGCTVRHVQKWAIKNNVDYTYHAGRKYYLWNEVKIREFADYYNRNYGKPKKRKNIPKWDNIIEALKLKLNLEEANKQPNFFYRNIVFHKPIRVLLRHWGWKEEDILQEIINGNQKLLGYFQYCIDNPAPISWFYADSRSSEAYSRYKKWRENLPVVFKRNC